MLGASATARNMGVSPLIIGLTIVGFGTSAPEMLVSGMAAYQESPGISIGNALGSNITNIALVLGVVEAYGTIFIGDYLDRDELGLVGEIRKVDLEAIRDVVQRGILPVVACLGESPTGQVMNINADIAARELIWEVKPHKIIFITGTGGLLDENGRIISAISLRTDFEWLIEQDWVHSGMQLKLEQMVSKRTTALEDEIYERKQAEIELKEAYTEIKQLQKQLQAESAYLQEEIKLEHNFENIIGQSEELKYVLHRVEMVAPQDTTVILQGETGTGKELFARAIHQLSSRNKRPLVKVNCAALPAELIESELFGREKGAFTGATTTQVGRFELADKSTLFLDEIGELPLELQAKLLRVLESGEFERLGSPRMLHSDARIITATNRDLEEEVRKKRFREDLWYRLKIFPITIPPLRNRTKDIPLLVDHFVQIFSRKMGKKAASLKITKSSMQALQTYPWPGNVRELEQCVRRILLKREYTPLSCRPAPDLPITRGR